MRRRKLIKYLRLNQIKIKKNPKYHHYDQDEDEERKGAEYKCREGEVAPWQIVHCSIAPVIGVA